MNRFKIWMCSLLLLFAPKLQAQTPEVLLDAGQQQWLAANFDSAYALFRAAQREAQLRHDASSEANALFLSGKYLTRQMQLDEGAATLDSAIALQKTVGWDHPGVILARRERASLHLLKGEMDSALQRYEALLADARRLSPEKDSLLAMCLHGQGIAFLVISDWENSLKVSQEALEIRKRIFHPLHITIGYSENSIGAALSWMDKYDESLQHYLQAEKIMGHHLGKGHPQLVQIRTNIGIHYADMGLYWKSLEYHKANMVYLENLPPEPHLGVLLNLATMLVSVGDDKEAWEVLAQAERLLDANPGMSQEHYAFIYSERGEILRERGDFKEAVQNINLTIEKETGLYGPDNFQLITSFYRKGITLLEAKIYPAAMKAFEESMRLAEKNGDEYSVYRAQSLVGMGDVLLEEGKLRPALSTYKGALAIFTQSEVKWRSVPIYKDMAVIWRRLGDFDSCMYMHRLAWEQVLPELPFREAPDARLLPFWPKNKLNEILVEQGNSLQLRFEQSKKIEDLQAALAAYQLALAVADSQRTYYDSPESRQLGVQRHRTTTENAIHLAFDVYKMTGEAAYLEKAFLLAEESKAGNLREHLRSHKALRFSGIPDSLLEREQYFQQRIAALEAIQYGEEVDSLQLAGARQLQFSLKQQYRTFLQKLEKSYPRYFHLKYPSETLSLQDVSQQLLPNQALYSYFWGERYLFVFQVFRGEWQMEEIVLTEDFEGNLNKWIGFISFPPEDNPSHLPLLLENTIAFTQQLLPGLSSDKNQLLIIPDGPLGYLPFESLLGTKTDKLNWKEWPFLLHLHTSTYSYSAALWLQQHLSKTDGKASYLGFAPLFSGEEIAGSRMALASLQFNQNEVKVAASLFHGKALLGPLAQESFVKSLPPQSNILHFATHALADESDLMRSRLFLDGTDDPGEDGILHAYEIYNLRLNSPLVVLSACQTALGPLQRGEGVMSLARAFQYSGAERVLSTLWQTDDRAGAEISKAFFAGLAAGKSTEASLQEARQLWLEQADNQHSHPYYWANYVLIGDGGVIPIKKSRPWAWIILFSSLALSLSLALLWRRRKKV